MVFVDILMAIMTLSLDITSFYFLHVSNYFTIKVLTGFLSIFFSKTIFDEIRKRNLNDKNKRAKLYALITFICLGLIIFSVFSSKKYFVLNNELVFNFKQFNMKAFYIVYTICWFKYFTKYLSYYQKLRSNNSDEEKSKISIQVAATNKASNNKVNDTKKSVKKMPTNKKMAYNLAMTELENLIGLEEVKEEVRNLMINMEMMKKKQKMGYCKEKPNLHMAFIGKAGTGKTTVARIVAQLLYGLGYLSKGHVVETDREGLIAGFIGQTATKTKEKVEEALGGVLFIDEAYSLLPREKGFEQECIDTLVKLMEDNRNDLVVIFAGYPAEMDKFLQSNSGLKSRVPYKFNFKNYSESDLIDIAKIMFKSKQYDSLSSESLLALYEGVNRMYKKADNENGRLIRNFIERVEIEQNIRLYNTNEKNNLMSIEADDINKSVAFILKNE